MVPGDVQHPRLSWDSSWRCCQHLSRGAEGTGESWLVTGPVLFCSSLPSWPMLGLNLMKSQSGCPGFAAKP